MVKTQDRVKQGICSAALCCHVSLMLADPAVLRFECKAPLTGLGASTYCLQLVIHLKMAVEPARGGAWREVDGGGVELEVLWHSPIPCPLSAFSYRCNALLSPCLPYHNDCVPCNYKPEEIFPIEVTYCQAFDQSNEKSNTHTHTH